MDSKYRMKNHLSKTMAALAVAIVTIGAINNPATAAPTKDSLKLAQVGIRSRINTPIPLNLRPRSHTPLPSSNYDHSRRDYRRYDRDYGYHHHTYGDRYERHRYNTRYKRRSNRGKVIILNAPGNLRGYGDRNSYIRVIRK